MSEDRNAPFALARVAQYRDIWESELSPGNPRRAEQLQVILALIPFTPAQSWHHVPSERKARLCRDAYETLAPGVW